jgi:antitoxin (DNA-binding transcriptional repressor) of toxin-antitoxin stability system
MKTLTVTEARKNLSGWLRRAKAGEDIGIIEGNRIIALRPVEVTSLDRIQVAQIDVDADTQESMDSISAAWRNRRSKA